MKKRLSKLALLAVAAAFVLVGFPACGDDDDDDPPLPATATIAGEDIPENGLALTAGTPQDVTATVTLVNGTFSDEAKSLEEDDTIPEGYLTLEAGEGITIEDVKVAATATDTDMKITFTVTAADGAEAGAITATLEQGTVKNYAAAITATGAISYTVAATQPDPTKTIESIAVKTLPTKVAYTVGDTKLDPAGLVITVTYTDTTTDSIGYSEANKDDFTFAGFDSSEPSESVTVTVKYKEKTATFTVSLAEAKEENSLFKTLSAQENNILAEDFATASTVSPFGAGFGEIGVYGADGVTVTDGAISTGSGTNRKIHVDFGPVKETVEGCVTLTVGGTQPQSGKNLLTFYNGDTAFLTIKTGTGDNTVGGIAGTYEIYYKFDLTAKTVSLKVNNTDVLTDSALTADSVSGYTIESHNSGKGTVAADNIAVCATKGDFDTYKAQVKAWLATLVTNTYSEEKGYTVNKDAVAQAKSTGDSAINAAADIDAVLVAYGNAQTALKAVKNDVTQAQENACTELDAYFPTDKTADSYTEEQLKAVTTAKEAGKTEINAATTVEAVSTALAEAKANIDKLPDSTMTAYTVTVKDSEDNELGKVSTYTTVGDMLNEIKKLAADKNKVIEDDKFYSEQGCTTEYDTTTALTADVTVYVKLEEKKNIDPITVFDGTTMTALDDMPKSVTRIDTGSKHAVDKNNKILGDKSFTYRFKFGGKDTDSHSTNALKIATGTTSAVKIVVYAMCSNSSNTGSVTAAGNGDAVELLKNSGTALAASEEISVTPDADGNIYIWAADNAMNVYYLYISQ